MKAEITVVGHSEQTENVWVELDSIPRVNEAVVIPATQNGPTIVRTVVWNLTHTEDGDEVEEPSVYIVVGSRRHSDER